MSLRLEVSKELYTSGQRTTIMVKKKKEEKSQMLIASVCVTIHCVKSALRCLWRLYMYKSVKFAQ